MARRVSVLPPDDPYWTWTISIPLRGATKVGFIPDPRPTTQADIEAWLEKIPIVEDRDPPEPKP